MRSTDSTSGGGFGRAFALEVEAVVSTVDVGEEERKTDLRSPGLIPLPAPGTGRRRLLLYPVVDE